jgi:hypothetical protein
MTTICLRCRKGTGVGEEAGAMGLPSLDEGMRGDGVHPLSSVLSSGGDADTDETFGALYSGFQAVGLKLHLLEAYKRFLQAHSGDGHRLYDWVEDSEAPPEGFDGKYRLKLYERPDEASGYVDACVVFECSRCNAAFESSQSELVKPLDSRVVPPEALEVFRQRTVRPAEFNMHEVYPFDIEYGSLETWFEQHEGHTIKIRLAEE